MTQRLCMQHPQTTTEADMQNRRRPSPESEKLQSQQQPPTNSIATPTTQRSLSSANSMGQQTKTGKLSQRPYIIPTVYNNTMMSNI